MRREFLTRLESLGHARNTLALGLGRSPPYTALDPLSAMAGYTADDTRLIHQHCVARVQGVAGICVVTLPDPWLGEFGGSYGVGARSAEPGQATARQPKGALV